MSIPYAAGSLYSTVEDLFLWDQALYGEKILSAKSKELMFKPNLNNYGYGFVMTQATLGPAKFAVPVIQHNGGINGFSTVIVRMTGDKRLIVLLDNAEDGQYLDQMVTGIMSVLYDQPYDMPRRSNRGGNRQHYFGKGRRFSDQRISRAKGWPDRERIRFSRSGIEPRWLSTATDEEDRRGDRNIQTECRDVSAIRQHLRTVSVKRT